MSIGSNPNSLMAGDDGSLSAMLFGTPPLLGNGEAKGVSRRAVRILASLLPLGEILRLASPSLNMPEQVALPSTVKYRFSSNVKLSRPPDHVVPTYVRFAWASAAAKYTMLREIEAGAFPLVASGAQQHPGFGLVCGWHPFGVKCVLARIVVSQLPFISTSGRPGVGTSPTFTL